jgi:hypothetical protein
MTRRLVKVVVLAGGLAACGDVAPPPLPPLRATSPRVDALADISRRVRRLAGARLKECGGLLSADRSVTAVDVLRAVDCGRAALAQREPFWLAFESPAETSFHSIHAQGLFAGRDGVPFQFRYESTFSLSDVAPTFVVTPCPRPAARNIGVNCN